MSENKVGTTETKDEELFTSVEQVKQALLEKGKKEGHLSHEEIADKLSNFELDADTMDGFFDELNENDIQLINEKDATDTDEKLNLHDMSAPPGGNINDPVRVFLKEIGRVDVLSAEDEEKLAKKMEQRDECAKSHVA